MEDGRLIVHQAEGSWLRPATECRVRVAVASLEAVEVAGSGDLFVRSGAPVSALSSAVGAGSGHLAVEAPVSAPALELTTAGSGDVVVDHFEGEALIARVGASGSIRASAGRAATADAAVEGSGGLDLAEVQAAECRARVAGSGDIQLRCADRLEASIEGSDVVVVFGAPAARDETIAGSGAIVYR